MKKPAMIKVTAKINAGTHRKHGAIIKGQQYTIDARDFAPQLFTKTDEETNAKATSSVPRPSSRSSKGRK